MKNVIKIEEALMFLLSYVVFTMLDYPWWLYLALILTPDIGMLGYIVNTKIGAFTYNLFHHKGVAIVVFIAGWYLGTDAMQLAGIILFGHSSMDRMLGYGLKFQDSFKNTHLGPL